MSFDALERAVLDGLTAELEAEGYRVVLQPRPPVLPSFMGSYKPDLVAFGPDRNMAIEVKAPNEGATKDVSRLTKLFKGRSDWEFRVYWIPETSGEKPLRTQNIADIDNTLSNAEALVSQGNVGVGLLLAWAIFEALGRKILTDRFVRPQTPGRLVEVMANEGVLTPDEATRLRLLVPFRNRLIHGELDAGIPADEVREFLSILRGLSTLARLPA